MAVLHAFKIIHCDIKPDNIMFSPSYKKNVFIDFGLSQIIEESAGPQSLSNFRGSPQYSSP